MRENRDLTCECPWYMSRRMSDRGFPNGLSACYYYSSLMKNNFWYKLVSRRTFAVHIYKPVCSVCGAVLAPSAESSTFHLFIAVLHTKEMQAHIGRKSKTLELRYKALLKLSWILRHNFWLLRVQRPDQITYLTLSNVVSSVWELEMILPFFNFAPFPRLASFSHFSPSAESLGPPL